MMWSLHLPALHFAGAIQRALMLLRFVMELLSYATERLLK